jgi:hypothetical protein
MFPAFASDIYRNCVYFTDYDSLHPCVNYFCMPFYVVKWYYLEQPIFFHLLHNLSSRTYLFSHKFLQGISYGISQY